MGTTVTITPVTEPAALFRHYDGETSAQPAYLSLDLEDGELTADYDPAIGNMPESVFHHRALRFDIACLTADAANRLLEDAAPIAQRILDGASIDWDGRNHVGRLDQAARAAEQELAALCSDGKNDDSDTIVEYEASDWFVEETAEQIIARLRLTGNTSDPELEAMAKTETDDARYIGDAGYVVLTGAKQYLTGLREGLRNSVRDELEEVAAEHAKLENYRNDLISRVSLWDSSRVTAERTGLSHVAVQKIAKRWIGPAEQLHEEEDADADL